MGRVAIILGATGLVGGHCLRLLLDSGLYERVTVITRRKIPLVHSKLNQLVVDFEQLDEALDAVSAQDIFCCLGTTMSKAGNEQSFRRVDYDYPLMTARKLKQRGGGHFLLISAIGANAKSYFFYNRVKGELEDALAALNFPHLTIVRPSLLTGDRDESRPMESLSNQVMAWMSPLMMGGLAKLKPIDYRKVASALVVEARKVIESERQPGRVVIDSDALQHYNELPTY
jgi:uncharacterized protein YbjT (DUF2867 family)